MCVFLRPLLFPHRVGRAWALISKYKTDQADFTDWMFLPSDLREEISHYKETFSAKTMI